jgi:hypothetical protein
MRPPNVTLRPNPRVFVKRRGTQNDIGRLVARCDDVTSAHRAKKPSLSR